jgi:hypothetical protein
MAYGSAGMQALAGLAAVVPGILAVTGNNTTILTLAALLTLGGTLVLSGSTLSATVLSLMQPSSSAGRNLPACPTARHESAGRSRRTR